MRKTIFCNKIASRTWALRQLHEDIYTNSHTRLDSEIFAWKQLTHATSSCRRLPENENRLSHANSNVVACAVRSELSDVHRTTLLDFADPDRLGYVRSRDQVAGFTAHAINKLDQELDDGEASGDLANRSIGIGRYSA